MRRVAVIIIGIGLVILGSILLIKDKFGESIEATAEAVAVNSVAIKINNSLKNGFYDEDLGEPLLDVKRDSEGNIQYLEPNTRLINKLLLEFSTNVKENYSLDDIEEIEVNWGVITGSKLLSQLPFTVTVKVQPISLTKFQYESEFETEGINQTRYKVYCTINSQIHIVAPFTDKTAEINRKVLLAEAVIVGKVPDNYVFVPEQSILDAV
ncbi:MAG: sporulation protein YunB [Firmicutes bacterium]|nr:sporulation protein YunB [Bacillota bacterium]